MYRTITGDPQGESNKRLEFPRTTHRTAAGYPQGASHRRQVKPDPAAGYPQGVPLPYTGLLAALAVRNGDRKGRDGVGADA